MPNINRLAGRACPECGSEGPFNAVFQVTVAAVVTDDGYDKNAAHTYGDTLCEPTSEWECRKCEKVGPPRVFLISEPKNHEMRNRKEEKTNG